MHTSRWSPAVFGSALALLLAATFGACSQPSQRIATDSVADTTGLAPVIACDRKALENERHWDSLRIKLVRRSNLGALELGGSATLIPFKQLHVLRDRDFQRQQAIALLDLSARQSDSLPAGVYCLTAQLDSGATPSNTGAWTIRFRRETAPNSNVFDSTGYARRGLSLYAPTTGGTEPSDHRPRPAARFYYQIGLRSPLAPAPSDSSLQNDDGEFAAWFRCGSGCCGAGLW